MKARPKSARCLDAGPAQGLLDEPEISANVHEVGSLNTPSWNEESLRRGHGCQELQRRAA